MATDRALVKAALAGLQNVIGLVATPQYLVSQQSQRARIRTTVADLTAAATSIVRVATFDRPVHVVSAKVFMEGYSVPSAASAYTTFTLFADNDAGGASYGVSSTGLSTNSVTLMQQQSQYIPLATLGTISAGATFNSVASGFGLYVNVAKASTGQTLPIWGIEVVVEED